MTLSVPTDSFAVSNHELRVRLSVTLMLFLRKVMQMLLLSCRRLFFTGSLLGLCASAFAQTAPTAQDASRRAESTIARPAVTPLRDDVTMGAQSLDEQSSYAPTSAGDNDLGDQLILKEIPKNEEFRAQADAFVFWTDNAAHASAGEIEDVFYGWRVAAGWQPRITNKLFGDVSVSQDWYIYDKLEALNFESFETSAGVIYIEPQLANILFFAQYQYGRLTSDFEDLLNAHSLRAGMQKLFLINRKNSFHMVLMADWDIETDVDEMKRHEYIFDIGYRYRLTRKTQLSLNYRYTFFDYQEVARQDCYQSLAFGISYTPWRWMELYASASYVFNDSDIAVYDYEAANVGAGLGMRVKF